MTLVTAAVYQRLTGDTTTAAETVTERLVDAQQLVEEYLRRPIESAERTETLRLYSVGGVWVVYPRATPVTAVPAGYSIDGVAVRGASPALFGAWSTGADPGVAELTYTGGWTAETVPVTVARAISHVARDLGTASPVPAGARAVSLGDASVSFDAGDAGAFLNSAVRAALRPYVRRRT